MTKKLIAIVGETGVGKTYLLKKYKHKNTIYIDDYVKNVLYQKETPIFEKIVETFGNKVIKNKVIDTTKLGQIVLTNKSKLEKLANIVNPAIKNYLLSLENKVYIVEIATYLKYENYFKDLFHEVVLIKSNHKHVANKFTYLKKTINLFENRIINDAYIINRGTLNSSEILFKLLDKLVWFK